MRALAALAALLSMSACGGQPAPSGEDYTGPRFTSEADHFSTRELPRWQMKRDRGSVVFVSQDEGFSRNTITVRAVRIEGDWRESRTPELVLPATERALRGMPRAKVSPGQSLERSDFRGAAFDLVYEPPGLRGKRYERRHVVLIGSTHVFHVIHTAPDGDLAATGPVFESVVASFREEG